MADITLPYLQVYKSRGKQFAYYRRGSSRARLTGEIGSPEFLESYKAAHEAAQVKSGIPATAAEGTFQALWDAYEHSGDFKQLAIETQKDYRRLLKGPLTRHGHRQVAGMNQVWVLSIRDGLSATPSRANRFVAVIRLLIKWGMMRGFRPKEGNPALGIPELRTGDGHRIWTDAEFTTMSGPDGGEMALPVLFGRYTLQREQDIIKLTWSAYDGHSITVTQAKSRHTKKPVTLVIPVHKNLKTALDQAKAANEVRKSPAITICTRPDGKPWGLSHFKHSFTKKRRELGLPEDLHFHGLRGTGASALAEEGATPHQIRAFTGHKTLSMVIKYTEGAEQKRTAKSMVTRLRRRQKTNKSV